MKRKFLTFTPEIFMNAPTPSLLSDLKLARLTALLVLCFTPFLHGFAAPGIGLKAEYFDDQDLTELRLTRIDPTVNFVWGEGSPDVNIEPEAFSVRWTGQIVPRYSDMYTFHTISDDGVRVRLDGVTVIENWTDHGPTENTGSIALIAGEAYDITIEFYENGGGATMQFLWSSVSQAKEVVPQSQLYPTRPGTPGQLSAQRIGPDQILLSWPQSSGPNPLQSRSSLNAGEWTTVSNTPALTGESYSTQLTIGPSNTYFRVLQSLKQRPVFPKPATFDVDPARVIPGQIILKFHEGTRIRLRGDALSFDSARLNSSDRDLMKRRQLSADQVQTNLNQIKTMLEGNPGWRVASMINQISEASLAQIKVDAEASSGEEVADFSLYYYFIIPQDDPAQALAALQGLNALPSVEVAYAQPRLQDADIPPTTTINRVPSQGYLEAAPLGIDARHAWSHPGGRGDGSRVIDIEGNWLMEHEDLTGREFYRNGIWTGDTDHGTSVLGVMVSADNGFGVTGIIPNADYGAGGSAGAHFSFESGVAFGIPAAILNALGSLRAGDVLLIEQHSPGPDSGRSCPCNCPQFEFVPQEFFQADFDAIRTATARGIIVVEAAGNGSMNLDSAVYGGRFDRRTRDSGAILVGASMGGGSLAPACFSNFGSRVDLHGWGGGVATLGGGMFRANGDDQRQWYQDNFDGTSSASPIVAGAICSLQGILRARGLPLLPPADMRRRLRTTGTPQANPGIQIGPLPNLRPAIASSLPSPTVAESFAGWQSLGGTLISGPAVGKNADQRLEVFIVGTENNHVWQKWQLSPGGGYSGWLARPAMTFQGTLAVERNQDGRLEVFGRRLDSSFGHSWQTSPNGNWSSWESLSGSLGSNPSVAPNADGRLEIVARRSDNGGAHIFQVAPNSSWSPWAVLGGIITGTPALTRAGDGRLETVARTSDGSYWNIFQLSPNGSWRPEGWIPLNFSLASDPALARHQDGRPIAFGRGFDNELKFSSKSLSGTWSGWTSVPGSLEGKPVVITGPDGRLNVFAHWTDHTVRHTVQTFPNSMNFTPWESLGGNVTQQPAVGVNFDGRIEVFVRGVDRALWRRKQVAVGAWR